MRKFSPFRRPLVTLLVASVIASFSSGAFAEAPQAGSPAPSGATPPGAAPPAAAPPAAAAPSKAPSPTASPSPSAPPAEAAKAPAAPAPSAPAPAAAKPPAVKDAKGKDAKGKGKAPPADPNDPKTIAIAAYEAGSKALDEGNFALAEEEFRKAEAALPSPHAEYKIALSIDKQSKEAEAVVAAYELFLSNPGAVHVGEATLTEVKARVAELKKTLPAEYTFTTEPAGAAISIDGTPAGVTPLKTKLAPGNHKLELSLTGYETSTIEILVEGGSLVEQPLALTALPKEAPPEPAAPPAPAPEPKSMVPAYVTLGLGGAGLIAGTIFGILAIDEKSQYDSRPSESRADAVERNALISDMSFGVAITLGITGLVLLTSEGDAAEKAKITAQLGQPKKPQVRRKPQQGTLAVAPFASPTSGGASARLTF